MKLVNRRAVWVMATGMVALGITLTCLTLWQGTQINRIFIRPIGAGKMTEVTGELQRVVDKNGVNEFNLELDDYLVVKENGDEVMLFNLKVQPKANNWETVKTSIGGDVKIVGRLSYSNKEWTFEAEEVGTMAGNDKIVGKKNRKRERVD